MVASLKPEYYFKTQWDSEKDAFLFQLYLSEKMVTHRGILSSLASLYDALGFFASWLLPGKILLQDTTQPIDVFSGNGSNFVDAQKELSKWLEKCAQQDRLSLSGTQWHFNPPYSNHRGGVWVRLIRCGHLHYPKKECVMQYEDELSYFRIAPEALGDCCYEDYHDSKRENSERLLEEKSVTKESADVPKDFRSRLWHAFENPEFSTTAIVIYYVTGFFIAVSVFANITETIPCGPEPGLLKQRACGDRYVDAFFCLDTACVVIFTIEYCARMYAAPNRWKFFITVMSIIDVVAILPFYIGLLMPDNKYLVLRLSLTIPLPISLSARVASNLVSKWAEEKENDLWSKSSLISVFSRAFWQTIEA
ncbi:unnamed protein product [Echinostoma caproni]|uniref:Ion transport domain-containing protein n=1 Tax=Echinostoma caproni TaxID=27848 RepID=A0A3P8GZ67_9TREM|nr:unnamed protein product [Echinostoma caproni]